MEKEFDHHENELSWEMLNKLIMYQPQRPMKITVTTYLIMSSAKMYLVKNVMVGDDQTYQQISLICKKTKTDLHI